MNKGEKAKPVKKRLYDRQFYKKIIIKSEIGLAFALKWIIRYSGIEFIYRKFNPLEKPRPLPTGVLWLVGLYIAFFGIVSQRYENRVDVIENRKNAVLALLAKDETRKSAVRNIPIVQRMECPRKPDVLNPILTLKSLFGKPNFHKETIKILNGALEDFKSDLSGVYLDSANLEDIDLQGANLEGAILRFANLKGANLKGANLKGANLVYTDFGPIRRSFAWKASGKAGHKVHLDRANLEGANLEKASLSCANLEEASLLRANLEGADLLGTDLMNAYLWEANLKGANLHHTNLEGAWLGRVILRKNYPGVIIEGTRIMRLDLEGDHLQGAKNLTIEQLSKVRTLYKAKLDPELEEQMRKNYPGLFEKPGYVRTQ